VQPKNKIINAIYFFLILIYIFHMYEFTPQGTCSRKIRFDIKNGKVYSLSFEKGCEGNLKALGILAEGRDAVELVQKLKGLQCGSKKTSCADQLAIAIEKYFGG
jgi:uncharacterized protein (TIGR03905 family)